MADGRAGFDLAGAGRKRAGEPRIPAQSGRLAGLSSGYHSREMPAPQSVVQAVQAAIVASAHLAAYEHVAAAAQACQRLGGLTSGRWRAAGRELASLEEDLQTAFANAASAVETRADELGVPEDALWA